MTDILDGMKPDLGRDIRRAFKGSKLSMLRLAGETGIPYSALHRFLVHEGDIRLSTVNRLCEALGLKLVADPAAKPIQPVKRTTRAAGTPTKGGR